jgi:alkylated DNA repair dioxygenase AlkB
MSLFSKAKPAPPVRIVRGWAAAIPYEMVTDSIPWSHYEVEMYGQTFKRPRLECWFHDDRNRTYTFGGGEPIKPIPMTRVVERVRIRLGEQGYGHFDSCFANRYESGQHSISWHADDEAWIGPIIASVNFGGSRLFKMKPKPGFEGEPTDFTLKHGDLLIMEAGCQDRWLHCVPKTKKIRTPRVNLTYRTTRY